jgi:hypothetical protein
MSGYDRKSMIVEFMDLADQGLQTVQPIWMQKDHLPEWAQQMKDEWIKKAQPDVEEMKKARFEQKPPPKPEKNDDAKKAEPSAK